MENNMNLETYFIKYILDNGVTFLERMCILKAEDESQAMTKFYKNIVDKHKSYKAINNICVYAFEDDTIIDTPYV